MTKISRGFWLVVGVGASLALLWLLIVGAHAQGIQPIAPLQPLGGGYSVTPDGGVSSWQDGSGYVVAPSGAGSWSPDGGYFVAPDGSVSSWSAPALVILPDGPIVLDPGQ